MWLYKSMENQDKKFVLVLSGGGSKGLYACGVLKAIEACGLKEQIAAVYGVSAGALSAAYWLSGWKAEDILERFLSAQLFSLKNIALPPKMSLLKSSVVEQFLKEDIKSDFAELELPLYVGATDIWQAEFKLFSHGELRTPVLASMSIPGVFPAVAYQDTMLVDGGVMCNFPLEYMRERHMNLDVIGVYLGQFKDRQPINSMIDTLLLSYEVSMQAHLLKDLDKVDYLFKRDLEVALLETSEEKIRKIFELGYQDGCEQFASC